MIISSKQAPAAKKRTSESGQRKIASRDNVRHYRAAVRRREPGPAPGCAEPLAAARADRCGRRRYTSTKEYLPMKRLCIVLAAAWALILLAACGGVPEGASGAPDPVSEVAPGMTLSQARETEPQLELYERENCWACDKAVFDCEGKLLIDFDGAEAESEAISVTWNAEPEPDRGKALYDELLAALGDCYGPPGFSRDQQEAAASGSILAEARWDLGESEVSCAYLEYAPNGACQVQYQKFRK